MPSKLRKTSKKRLSKQLEILPKAADKRRLFIDPASISSGWALYEGAKLVAHGTVATEKKWSVFVRLHDIWRQYRQLSFTNLDEVHIEKLPRRCHHYTMWSVGVIGHALVPLTSKIDDEAPVKSWQKHVSWRDVEGSWKERGYKSEDEFAAVCIGKWYVETRA